MIPDTKLESHSVGAVFIVKYLGDKSRGFTVLTARRKVGAPSQANLIPPRPLHMGRLELTPEHSVRP